DAPVHQLARLVDAPGLRERGDEPEGARDERSLLGDERRVAREERASAELVPDRLDRAEHPVAASVLVVEEREGEEARVDLPRAGRPDVRPPRVVPATLVDEAAD